MRDKKFGYADIKIKNLRPHLPYILTGFTHNGEVKFFIWAEAKDWGFVIVPVYREDENLYIGKEEFFNYFLILKMMCGLKISSTG